MSTAKITAEKLIQTGAIKISPRDPFTWASGWKSPIYCDNRQLLSEPYTRDYIKSELVSLVFEKFSDAEVIAGVATAGIPWGVLIADQLKLPFVYVRPKPKEHGLGKQVEGALQEKQKVVVVEDLVSTGKSSLQVVEALKMNNVQILGMVCVFSYGFQAAAEAMGAANISLYSLTSYADLLDLQLEKEAISETEREALLKWRQHPAEWTGMN